MPDMLVRLYDLPDAQALLQPLALIETTIRRAHAHEQSLVTAFVLAHFADGWAAESAIAFRTSPPSCFLACAPRGIVGFACHDCTRRNYFGPTGVAEAARGFGIGRALLVLSLHAMREAGYAYAIIGGVGPAAFYEKAVGAVEIAGSTPGIYRVAPSPATAATIRMITAIPKLASSNIERSLAFYEGLGFRRVASHPHLGIVARDAVQLHLWRCDDPAIARVTGCRIDVAEIALLFAEYAALGIVHPNGALARQPWGYREFSILDEDGNLITFAERAA